MSQENITLQEQVNSILNGITTEMYAAELAHEREMFDRGRANYIRSCQKAVENGQQSQTDYGMALIRTAIRPVANALDDWIAKAQDGKAGLNRAAARLLSAIPSDLCAYLAIRKVIDGYGTYNWEDTQPIAQNIALAVGNEIMTECQLTAFKEDDPENWQGTKSYLSNVKNRRHKVTVYKYASNKSDLSRFEPWSYAERQLVGQTLLRLIANETGYIEYRLDYSVTNNRQYYVIVPTAKLTEWILTFKQNKYPTLPEYQPMLIPPKPWTGVFDGGYWKPSLISLTPLIKGKNRDKEYLNAVDLLAKQGKIDEVLLTINALQNTPWRINQTVLKCAVTAWQNSWEIKKFPQRDRIPIPVCPFCGADMSVDTQEKKKHHDCFSKGETGQAILKYKKLRMPSEKGRDADKYLTEQEREIVNKFNTWKSDTHDVHDLNAKNTGKKINLTATLSLALKYSKIDRFYFPYQLDFRTRVYPIPSYLNPQTTDLSKGLLEFAEGKPLGTQAAVDWLKIHVANTHGEDKLPFTKRLAWVELHEKEILAIAENPLENRDWINADKPFCYLAACLDYAGYLKEGLAHVSHLPVAMDGTCNGLQLYSLMLRDEIGGYATNLIPADSPQDIYAIVADKVKRTLKHYADNPAKYDKEEEKGKMTFNKYKDAKQLLKLPIDRSATKRQVMVLPYGGTKQSCLTYTRAWQADTEIWTKKNKHLTRTEKKKFEKEFNRLSFFLANEIWDAMKATVVKAQEAMQWLQDVARLTNKHGYALYWETPCGFPVKQEYQSYATRKIASVIGDTIMQFKFATEPDGLNERKQINSIAPNYIHSFDASCLMKTVCRCLTHGITSFAMVHDSYGTHAADAPMLADYLRLTFCSVFSQKYWLEDFQTKLLRQYRKLSVDMFPPLPKQGTLNIWDVRKSKYFFA